MRPHGPYPICKRGSLHVGHEDMKGAASKNGPRLGEDVVRATARWIIFAVILAPIRSFQLLQHAEWFLNNGQVRVRQTKETGGLSDSLGLEVI